MELRDRRKEKRKQTSTWAPDNERQTGKEAEGQREHLGRDHPHSRMKTQIRNARQAQDRHGQNQNPGSEACSQRSRWSMQTRCSPRLRGSCQQSRGAGSSRPRETSSRSGGDEQLVSSSPRTTRAGRTHYQAPVCVRGQGDLAKPGSSACALTREGRTERELQPFPDSGVMPHDGIEQSRRDRNREAATEGPAGGWHTQKT